MVKLEKAEKLKDTGGYREEVTTIMNEAYDVTSTGKAVAKKSGVYGIKFKKRSGLP